MTRFVDIYLSSRIQGYPAEVGPMTSTQIARVDSGSEQANQRWQDAIRTISIPQGARDMPTVEALKRHWLVMAGPARTWPWRDPTDFATADLLIVNEVPAVSRTDQEFGVGDGITKTFQLRKNYVLDDTSPIDPNKVYQRPIHYPVVSTVLIGINGADPAVFSPHSTWSVTRQGGEVTFNVAPPIGAVLTWGGLFDLQVRFDADDTFKGMMQTFAVAGFADIPLTEVLFCEDD